MHPLFGARADASCSWERGAHRSETELLVRNFGIEPVFVFDPGDPSNRPVPGDRALTWWPIYPEQCRRVFTRAFTAGLHDASLNGRVTEGTWRRVLLALHDCVRGCPACRAELFYDPEQTGPRCWNCSAPLPVPVTLKLPGSLLVLSEGAVLTSHHLHRDRDHRTACAVVEPDPRLAGRVVLRNRTDRIWTVIPDGEEPKRVAPGQRLGVRPMRIDFGPARGQIR
jgi:hypothetical protein